MTETRDMMMAAAAVVLIIGGGMLTVLMFGNGDAAGGTIGTACVVIGLFLARRVDRNYRRRMDGE